ncbi:hypothetical protein [Amantichitinum ursilacus]|uniref:Alpha-L-arabinofuranosidase 1 catalytic domain-containing protein n=1 Tax=Amantichitinum ursilacus TaxID=857265 RepID=A0A0N1JSJ4_9NEIS|nr:hypothetical protein [Amantichitinum ursilacus]KPC52527.1 hypothetical protein WG78_11800 [Amantichitinum ursilacus]
MNSRRKLLKAVPAAALSAILPPGMMLLTSEKAAADTAPTVYWSITEQNPPNTRQTTSELFGFNVPWGDFQQWFVGADNKVKSIVTANLKVFSGALYRYPGGTPSNAFLWRWAIGSTHPRPSQPWTSNTSLPADFGIDEFLAWVRNDLQGKVVYTLNMQTFVDKNTNVPKMFATPSDFAADALELMSYILSTANGDVVEYWELGNELDASPSWPGATYAAYAAELIKQANLSTDAKIRAAKIVIQTATNIGGATHRQTWNADVKNTLAQLGQSPDAISAHEYYEMPGTTADMYGMLTDIGIATAQWPNTPLLVTEHAIDLGIYDQTTAIHKYASAMEGGIAAADFTMLALWSGWAGANWHALEHGAAWELFHITADSTKTIYPSAILPSLVALRLGVPVGGRLVNHVVLKNSTSTYPYAQHLMAFMDSTGTKMSVVGVNRSAAPISLKLAWPNINQSTKVNIYIAWNAALGTVTDASDNTDTVQDYVTVIQYLQTVTHLMEVSGDQTVTLPIPAKSVFALIAI